MQPSNGAHGSPSPIGPPLAAFGSKLLLHLRFEAPLGLWHSTLQVASPALSLHVLGKLGIILKTKTCNFEMLSDFCRCFQVTVPSIDPLQHLAALSRASSLRDVLVELRPNLFGHCKTTNRCQLHRLDLQWLSIGPLCLHMAPSAGMKLLSVASYTVS